MVGLEFNLWFGFAKGNLEQMRVVGNIYLNKVIKYMGIAV